MSNTDVYGQRGKRWAQQMACAVPLGTIPSIFAQTIEDHSLQKSAVQTFHVKCIGGRLAMICYDTRADPVNLCASAQDGPRPYRCNKVARAQVVEAVKSMAEVEL